MRQLTAREAGLLGADTSRANANISLLHIFDQATAAGGVVRFKSILAHVERRLQRLPLLRQRLQQVPLGLGLPYWVDDAHFDLEYHVRHIALPKPGDWRQCCIQVARIHARALDLGRPPWEAYVIEGLDSFLDLAPGSFALLFKTHQAAVDLQQLSPLSALLLDDDAKPPPDGPAAPWFADSAAGSLGMLARGLTQTLAHPAAAPLWLARPLAAAVRRAAPAVSALASDWLLRPAAQRVTRFNSVLSPHRVFETRRFTEAEFAAVCTLVPGATVDEAVAAVCGGALRRYLDRQGELPEGQSLVAVQPVFGALGSQADAGVPAWRQVLLGSHIADPLQRLQAVHTQAGQPLAPALALPWRRRLANQASVLLGPPAAAGHCSLTLLPAPSAPLYLCGARMGYFSALLPVMDGLGLAFAVTRYDGRVIISPTACRELLPDPDALALCLRDSFQDYLALAQHAATAAAGMAATPATRARKRSPLSRSPSPSPSNPNPRRTSPRRTGPRRTSLRRTSKRGPRSSGSQTLG